LIKMFYVPIFFLFFFTSVYSQHDFSLIVMNSINVNGKRPTIYQASVTFEDIPGRDQQCSSSTSTQRVLPGKTAIFKADARYCQATSIKIAETKIGETVITQSCQRVGLSIVEASGNSIKADVLAQSQNNGQPCRINIPAAGNDCCYKKTVDGISYTLHEESATTEEVEKYQCSSSCKYIRDNDVKIFCFKAGGKESVCTELN